MSNNKKRNYNKGCHDKACHTKDCVCDVVKRIATAQDEQEDNSCSTSCNQSIQQLRGVGNAFGGPRNNTIPFILYCHGSCDPFIGSGVFQAPKGKKGSFFGSVETPVFRVKKFAGNGDCCAKLELLLPVTKKCGVYMPQINKTDTISAFFPEDDPVCDFQATGICLTVDLSDFIGITCLDPIRPLASEDFYYDKHDDDYDHHY